MTRNTSRTQAQPVAQPTVVPAPVQSHGVTFTVPTEIVHLSTGGQFYPENSSLHGKESIEIKYMTAKEEDILTSPSLLKEGKTIDRLLESVMVDKTINVEDFLVADRNALLVACRVTGFGSKMPTNISCTHCGGLNEVEFDLTEMETETLLEDGSSLGVAREGPFYSFELPISKVHITIRPLFVSDEKYLEKLQVQQDKLNLPQTRLTDSLRQIIVSVNGDVNESTKNNFIDVMPAQDSRHIRNIYKLVVPSYVGRKNMTCLHCQRESEVEVPFNTDFFWPGQ
jgi:hypothetical protein